MHMPSALGCEAEIRQFHLYGRGFADGWPQVGRAANVLYELCLACECSGDHCDSHKALGGPSRFHACRNAANLLCSLFFFVLGAVANQNTMPKKTDRRRKGAQRLDDTSEAEEL